MSILIKGMKMPKRCIDCPFMVSRDNDDCILQSDEANSKFYTWDDMKADCPLVEVKEPHGDLVDRQAAIDALWKALYEYEDKMEKQFQESDELDIGNWILHRMFVQNMSDIDRQTILNLPSAQPINENLKFLEFLWNRINPNEMEQCLAMYQSKEVKTDE